MGLLWSRASQAEVERANRMLDEVKDQARKTEIGLDKHIAECKLIGEQTQQHLHQQDKTLGELRTWLIRVFVACLGGALCALGALAMFILNHVRLA